VGGGSGQANGVEAEQRLEGAEVAPSLSQQRRSQPGGARALGLTAERRLGLQQAIQQVVLPGIADQRLGRQLGLVGQQREEAAVDPADPGRRLLGSERFEQVEERLADVVGDDASQDAEGTGPEQIGADQSGAASARERGKRSGHRAFPERIAPEVYPVGLHSGAMPRQRSSAS
jgi:hypothetical protein